MARRYKTKSGAASRRTLPARGAKTSAIAGLAEVNKAENTPIPGDDGPLEGSGAELEEAPKPVTQYIPLAPDKPIEVFATFNTTANLDNGVCVLRKIADGQYQLVNLSTVADGAMGSQDTGAVLMEDKGLLKLLNIKDKDWADARIKCNQAVLSARGEIFYFFTLPLEIREMVYKLCFFRSTHKLTAGMVDKPGSEINHAFLRASRTVYEEGAKYFQANTFLIVCPSPLLKVMAQLSTENIRNLHIQVRGHYLKDQESFAFVEHCTSLKKLEVIYTSGSQYTRRARPQYLHQSNSDLGAFRTMNGFDILCSLRGLDNVVVTVEPSTYHGLRFSESTRKKFETFLLAETTKPRKTQAQLLAEEQAEAEKQRKIAKALKVKKNKGRRGGGRKASAVDLDDSEDEYDGTSRSWAH